MSDNTNDDQPDDMSSNENIELQATAVTSPYKVLGQLDADSGVGVLGQNDASNGTPIGVQGAVPNNSSGYGLATPNDARIEGTVDTNETDFIVETGTQSTADAASVVLGHRSNAVTDSAVGATVAGGGYDDGSTTEPNQVYDDYGTVGGGRYNHAGTPDGNPDTTRYATVAGGQENAAEGFAATVGGGFLNESKGIRATVAGGKRNDANEDSDTIAGGKKNSTSPFLSGDSQDYTTGHNAIIGGLSNEANRGYATVGGGRQNKADGRYATIGGGRRNKIEGPKYATIAGGGPTDLTDLFGTNNTVHDDYGTVGGGGDNQAGSQDDTTNDTYATVPGGKGNTASGRFSFAAGHRAKATDVGSFVWADSADADISSSGADQFVVEASGGIGLGTSDPLVQFHLSDDTAGQNDVVGDHIGLIEDPSDTDDNSLLALRTGFTGDPGLNTNFLTFFNGNDSPVGSIEGNDSGGVVLDDNAADYAEYLPRLDPDEEVEPAEVVGIVDGQVTKRTVEAEQALVVSSQPVIRGNSPGQDRSDRERYEVCAFVGQAPVKVRGPVESGDLVVPSGENDGIARAIAPGEFEPGDGPLVGRAWEDDDSKGIAEVTVAVGIDDPTLLVERLTAYRDRVQDLEAENEQLRERVVDIEEHLGIENGSDQVLSADD